jgi:8-oxo-dGTP pyrophosphatase MutT (NUDIX family)
MKVIRLFNFFSLASCVLISRADFNAEAAPSAAERMASIDIVGGFVFYRNLGGVMEYLLLEKKTEPGDWSVPKGKADVESDETQLDAALREFYEETKLSYPEDYKVTIEWSERFEYETNDGVTKKVRLYPAELLNFNKPIELGEENSEYRWLLFDDALALIKEQYKTAFENSHAYIESKEPSSPSVKLFLG